MKTVLYLIGTGRMPDHRTLIGVDRFARQAGWKFHAIESRSPELELKPLIDVWKPDGLIIRRRFQRTPENLAAIREVPSVIIGYASENPKDVVAVIHNDEGKTAKDAAGELLRLELADYAYITEFNGPERIWDKARCHHFCRQLEHSGRRATVFHGNREDLKAFLSARKRPFGIMAATDNVAVEVMGVCEQLGIAIPDDAAVIGVDNDTTVCETSRPTLSSVALDYVGCGEFAAQMLDRAMRGKRPKVRENTYGNVGVVRRASTNRFSRIDHEVSAAVERIRLEACRGLSAKEALSGFSCSRRMAEIRFRQITGTSPLAMIRETRLANAKEMIATGNTSLAAISNFCGYKTAAALTALFRGETGTTPSDWKRSQ